MSRPAPQVLMTADAVGGVWRYALDLARGLARRGVRTTLAVVGPQPDTDQREEASATPGLTLVAPGLALDWTAQVPAEVEAAGGALARLARDVGADLVHLNSPAYAAAVRFPAPVVGVAHSCVATWWSAVKGDEPLPEDFLWRTEFVARGYAACDALLAPTRAFAEATARAYGGPAPIAAPNGRRRVERARDAAPGGFVFTAGRLWDEGKNLAVLDAAAGRLGLPVYAAGPTRGPQGASRRFSNLRLLGRLDEYSVANWLAARPLFVSTALYEPFGLAVLEAAQAGCALVLSDIASFRELWAGAAVFVDPRDPAVVARALSALAADPARRASLAEAAAARARAYSVEAMTGRVLETYARVAPAVFANREAAA